MNLLAIYTKLCVTLSTELLKSLLDSLFRVTCLLKESVVKIVKILSATLASGNCSTRKGYVEQISVKILKHHLIRLQT